KIFCSTFLFPIDREKKWKKAKQDEVINRNEKTLSIIAFTKDVLGNEYAALCRGHKKIWSESLSKRH
ncbi:MAG: hypothetical protein J7539_15655, partial [Niabella sp.]|nr:hypothetical protein [Niabella sp.]